MRTRRRWLAGGAAAVAIVLGGGAALAASGTENPASSFLGDVAKRLGISESKLTDAIQAAQIDRIDAAVARGDLTKEQGDALKERVRSGDAPAILPGFRGLGPRLGPLSQGFGLGHHGFAFGFGLGRADLLDTAADYLGVTEAQLRESLRDGTSLAEVAKDKGKSVDGLKQALRDVVRKQADEAVDDGALTKEQADRLVEKLSGAIDDLVDGVGAAPGLRLRLPKLGLGLPPLAPGLDLLPKLRRGIGLAKDDMLDAAAGYLGVTRAQLRESLSSGKTLADVAKDRGKSVDGLKDAIKKAVRANVDEAVDDGTLTKAQADRLYDALGKGVDAFVDGGFRLRLGGRHGGFRFEFRLDENGPSARIQSDAPMPSLVF